MWEASVPFQISHVTRNQTLLKINYIKQLLSLIATPTITPIFTWPSREEMEDEQELQAGGIQFTPPVYRQRYAAVLELARKLKPKKVKSR